MWHRGRGWRPVIRSKRLGAVAGLALMIGGVGLAPLVSTGGAADEDGDDSSPDTASAETATVQRGDLVEETDANGTVGHGETTSLPIDAEGLVTAAPESGDVIEPGDVLLRVGDKPVYLAEGAQPLYRELKRNPSGQRDEAGDKVGLQTGADVEQLQQFLLNAGFDDKGRLEVDGEFGLTTERAVKNWQRSVGHAATGRVDRTQLVFAEGALRVESAPAVGQSFSELSVTSGNPKVSLTVTAAQKPFFDVGAKVQVESATAQASGTVTSQKRTVGDDGTTRYAIEVELDADAALGDAEVVKVKATRTKASGVLTVPVRALVALAEGGWAVQVDSSNGPQLTAVELGDVVNGLAEIYGVDEGTKVVVPV